LIKKAIEAIFGVKVQKVNMLNQKGKTKRFKGIIGK
jgi:large subunit ribosomal protein L23